MKLHLKFIKPKYSEKGPEGQNLLKKAPQINVKKCKITQPLDFQSQFSVSKIIRIFLNFFSLKNINFGACVLLMTIFENFSLGTYRPVWEQAAGVPAYATRRCKDCLAFVCIFVVHPSHDPVWPLLLTFQFWDIFESDRLDRLCVYVCLSHNHLKTGKYNQCCLKIK